VTELEYSMLLLAAKIGIIVPEFRLLPTAHLENLPSDLPEMFEGDCLISQRFDRTPGGGRIHMEDFAQVFAIRDKYDPAYNYQSIANVLWIESGLDAVLELVRRLVYMIVTGNGDMHLKNWSLIYPDGRQAKLAPAYDFVSTKVYSSIEPRLALKMAGTREFADITIDTFKKFAKIAQLPERPVINTVIETVDAIKECWPKLRQDFSLPESFKRLIEEHMKSVPLFYEQKNSRYSSI
jgi:serine/threonine-protein kinase HipA